MKRFLVFLVVAIAVVSLGLSVYYFTKDNEVIYINSTYITLNQGNTIKTDDLLTFKNASKYTKIDYSGVKDKTVLSFNDAEKYYTAIDGGETEIVITTSNKQYRSIVIKVVVRDGSEEYPYLIGSQADLMQIGTNSQFTNDVNYELEKSFALNTKWTPIENFKGTFNGSGYTISNIDISAYTDAEIEASKQTTQVDGVEQVVETELTQSMKAYNEKLATLSNVGLFDTLDTNAVVSNLTLKGVNISGAFQNVGAVAGINKGAIRNVAVSTDSKTIITTTGEGEDIQTTEEVVYNKIESTTNNANVAGVVGYNFGSTENTPKLDRVSSTARLNIAATSQRVAGLVGYNLAGKITESYYNGYVVKTANGGFAGLVSKNEPLTETANSKTIYHTADLIDSYAIISTTSADGVTDVVGLIGENVATNASSTAYENQIFGNYYGELRTYTQEGTYNVSNITALKTGDASKISNNGYSTIQFTVDQFKDQNNFISYKKVGSDFVKPWNFETVWQMFVEGDVSYPVINRDSTNGSTYEIDVTEIKGNNDIDSNTTPAMFHTLLTNNKDNGSYVIKEDLDFTGYEWTPISYFNGTITGEKFTDGMGVERYPVISNLTIKLTNQNGKAGLFEILKANAIISNLTFENVNIIGSENAYNAYATGVVAGQDDGSNIYNVSIKNVTNKLDATIFGTFFGVSYLAEGHSIKNVSVDNVLFDGVITEYAGGIVGFNGESNTKPGTVITGTEKRGNTPAQFITVTNFNAVARKLGGIAGVNKGTIKYVQAGVNLIQTKTNDVYYDPDLITNSKYNVYVGGIAGQNTGVIDYAKSSSQITLDTFNGFNLQLGGIAGNNFGNNSVISHSYTYNTNITTKNTYNAQLGGIVGNTSGLVELCVVASDCKIVAATSVARQDNASFVGGVAGYIALASGKVGAINKSASYASNVTGFYAGGIVGYSHGSVTASFTEGSNVTGYYVGGLASIINSYWGVSEDKEIVAVSVNNYSSGFFYADYAIVNLNGVDNGGDLSALQESEIYNLVANRKNGATAGFAVLITYGARVDNCYTVPTMTGSAKYSATISRNTGLTDLDKESDVNARKASSSGIIINSIYTTQDLGDDKLGGTYVDKASLKVSGNYTTLSDAGLDIDNWDMDENEYPTIARLKIEFNKFFDYNVA